MQNGSCIEFRVEVKFGNNEIKNAKKSNKQSSCTKWFFEFIENNDYETQDQCWLWG